MGTNAQNCHIIPEGLLDAVKLLSGTSLANLNVIIWAKWVLFSGPSLFQPIFIVVSSDFCTLRYHLVFLCGPVVSQFSKTNIFQTLGAKFVFLANFPVLR